MSQLVGADTRRVDVIADGLHGYSQEVQNLRSMAQRAVIEMRDSWGGRDSEHFAQHWEQEVAPRLTEVSSSLSAMAVALRSQAAEQRGVSQVSAGASRAGVRAGVSVGEVAEVGAGGTYGGSLVSVGGRNDHLRYELSAGKVEAWADSSVDVGGHGNLGASAGAWVGAYVGYAAGRAQAGDDFARIGADGKAYVGAEVGTYASGSVGSGGARGELGAEAFAGGKVVVNAGGTVAGVTAAAGADVSYGIGAQARVEAEWSATGIGVSLDVGATLGIGAGVRFDVSVDPQEVVASVERALAPDSD